MLARKISPECQCLSYFATVAPWQKEHFGATLQPIKYRRNHDTMIFNAWGHCFDCHFEGMLEYRHITGENYSDEQAAGVMLVQHCPACESTEHALIPIDYYREMMEELQARLESMPDD